MQFWQPVEEFLLKIRKSFETFIQYFFTNNVLLDMLNAVLTVPAKKSFTQSLRKLWLLKRNSKRKFCRSKCSFGCVECKYDNTSKKIAQHPKKNTVLWKTFNGSCKKCCPGHVDRTFQETRKNILLIVRENDKIFKIVLKMQIGQHQV